MRHRASPLALFLVAAVVAAPPPSTTAQEAQVPAAYLAIAGRVREAGRQVARWCADGDAAALFARFDGAMRAQVSEATLQGVLDSVRAAGPLGERREEGIWPFGPGLNDYLADHDLGAGVLTVGARFDGEGQVAGLGLTPREPLPPDPHAEYATVATLRLPFEGDWWVVWGGRTRLRNYHVVAADQRHAYDFVIWREGGTFHGAGTRNEEYWAWDRPVLAPGDATVIAVQDGVIDNRPRVQLSNPSAPAGNHVVLDFGTGEYALIAHFRRGSLQVKVGDVVRAGQLLGRCGNSGNSSEPHVHIHLQDRPTLFRDTAGLPLPFTGYLADGERVARGEPVQGQFVRHLEPTAGP
jgi:hypothetical protein